MRSKHAVENALKGTAAREASSALTALANMPKVLDTLKQKLAQLNAVPIVSDQQIAEVQKLKTAIDQLSTNST